MPGNGAQAVAWGIVKREFAVNEQRQKLYQELEHYNSRLLEVVGEPFRQWLDGSFVSAKPHPKDIDVVSFLPWDTIKSNLSFLHEFKQPDSVFQGLDCYLVIEYPPHDTRYALYKADEGYWNDRFRKTGPINLVAHVLRLSWKQ